MKKFITASILVTIILTSGCAALRDFANVQQPTVDFTRVSVQSINFDGVSLLFDFDVNNPNQVGIDAKEYSYEFFINDNSFVTGRQVENLRINRMSSSVVQVPVTLNFSEMMNTFGSLAGRDSLSYQIASEVQFEIPGLGTRTVHVSAAGDLPIPRLPAVEFGGFDVKNISLSGAEMEIAFRITNPNSFGLNLSNAAYVLNVNGREWLDTRLVETIRIGAKESNMVRIPVRLDAAQMGSVFVEMLSGSTEFQYNLSGAADVSADIVEFDAEGRVPFNVSGTYRTN